MPRGIPKRKTEATKENQGNGQGVTKLEAVKQALAQLGNDAKPQPIKEFVKSKFSLDMPTQLISNYKTVLAKKAGRQGAIIRRPEEQAAVPAGAIRQAAPAGGAGGITLDEVRAVKAIVDRIGADRVRELAAVLSP